MSTELLKEVQERTKRTNGTLKLQRCELNLQAYSHMGLQLKHVAPIHLTVGPMDLVHPVYVSTLNTYPLFIGEDLLNRFEPLIDFKHLKIWTQVREPLPCQSLDSNESQCQVTDTAPNSLIDDAVEKPGSGPSTNSKDPFLCSLQEPESCRRTSGGAAEFRRLRISSAQYCVFFSIFDLSFYTCNVCNDYVQQENTFGHWTALH